MSLNDLLKKAKTATTEAHNELDKSPVSVPSSVKGDLSPRHLQPASKLRYLIDLEKTTFTPEEIRALLPELQEFARLGSAVLSPYQAVRQELSRHFPNPMDMDDWLDSPNEMLGGNRPRDIDDEDLLSTLQGLL